ncbi:hypothetical protein HPP92_028997 [Vanilla planifolia]|uniref:Uncharacterized protein n=1 Tax=Vanilla planifolia TaxID=51239 RepID=A0A835P3D4_VANPL|nr:hypothetical protein HPP92_028997 [Vanilla planifolia]KAG0446120.1 hypothetical protein HPP92_028986 [Vanilla planifolia]
MSPQSKSIVLVHSDTSCSQKRLGRQKVDRLKDKAAHVCHQGKLVAAKRIKEDESEVVSTHNDDQWVRAANS